MAFEDAAVRKLQKPSVCCEPPHVLTGLTFLLPMGTRALSPQTSQGEEPGRKSLEIRGWGNKSQLVGL